MDASFDSTVSALKMRSCLYPVILSGGSGTRLWPLSRQSYPKQLLPLVSERSMLQETVSRTPMGDLFASPFVICNEEHRFLIAEQLRQIQVDPLGIVLEPIGRNTAPAITVAAMMLAESDPEAVMLVEPSDHFLGDRPAFLDAVQKAAAVAARGHFSTFGVVPGHSETGYGYIQNGDPIDGVDGAFVVNRFVEKPDAETAERLVRSGEFYWNSGIFVLPAALYLEEVKRLQPMIYDCCEQAIERGSRDGDFTRLHGGEFAECPDISIDKAVMELTERAAVIPIDVGWNDIGSWNALRDTRAADEDGNVLEGDVITHDARNSFIHSDGRLVAAVDIDDLVIVATDDAVLVSSAKRSGEVREIVAQLKRSNRQEQLYHRKVYRPWGFYQTVDEGERFQVKRIMVNPGASLSLQMHHHRAEHWVVVTGTARVTRNDESILLTENQSSFIPVGVRHRLENPGKVPLHLIEVQSGPYLGEDDIVRFEDTYGRS